jgi:hypothetical protein
MAEFEGGRQVSGEKLYSIHPLPGEHMIAQTYRAMLRGDQVDWIDPPPQHLGETEVQITLLPSESEDERRARGLRAAAALERLAKAGAFDQIEDPVAWQREIRQDRPLPGRDE